MHPSRDHALEAYNQKNWSVWRELEDSVEFWRDIYLTYWELGGSNRPSYLPDVDSESVSFQHSMAPKILRMARTLSISAAREDGQPGAELTKSEESWLRVVLGDVSKSPVVRDYVALEVADAVLSRLNGAEERAIKLVSLVRGRGLGALASAYVKRATSLYVDGYNVEAAIFCRSALEASLGNRCSAWYDDNEGTPDLYRLLRIAGENGVLDGWEKWPKDRWSAKRGSQLYRADQLRRMANHLVHEVPDFNTNPTEIRDAFHAIEELCSVVGWLFPAPEFQ